MRLQYGNPLAASRRLASRPRTAPCGPRLLAAAALLRVRRATSRTDRAWSALSDLPCHAPVVARYRLQSLRRVCCSVDRASGPMRRRPSSLGRSVVRGGRLSLPGGGRSVGPQAEAAGRLRSPGCPGTRDGAVRGAAVARPIPSADVGVGPSPPRASSSPRVRPGAAVGGRSGATAGSRTSSRRLGARPGHDSARRCPSHVPRGERRIGVCRGAPATGRGPGRRAGGRRDDFRRYGAGMRSAFARGRRDERGVAHGLPGLGPGRLKSWQGLRVSCAARARTG